MPQDPHVTTGEGVGDAVVWARDQHVRIASRGVLDPPPPITCRISGAHNLPSVDVPVRCIIGEGWIVILPNDVVSFSNNVEVEPPIDVVVVDLANARILYSREPEAGADGPILVEAPLADIPIIAC